MDALKSWCHEGRTIMDAHRFDTVVKALRTDTTRRRMLRGLVAGMGGGALVHLTERAVPAAGKCCAETRKFARTFCA